METAVLCGSMFVFLRNQSALDHQITEMIEAESEDSSSTLIAEHRIGLYTGAMLIVFDYTIGMAGWTPN